MMRYFIWIFFFVSSLLSAEDHFDDEPDSRKIRTLSQGGSAKAECSSIYDDFLALQDFWNRDAHGKGYLLSRFITRGCIKITKEYSLSRVMGLLKGLRIVLQNLPGGKFLKIKKDALSVASNSQEESES